MVEIFGITFYTNFFAFTLFCFLAAGATVLFFLVNSKKRMPRKRGRKMFSIHLSLLALLFCWLHYDIFLAGLEIAIKQYRKECGMHIYRRNVALDGFAGLASSTPWLNKYGIPYVELENLRGEIFRFSMVNGKEVEEKVDEYSSPYIYTSKIEGIAKYLDEDFIAKQTYFIADRINGDVLGEIITIHVGDGWADKWVPPGPYTGFSCCEKEMKDENIVIGPRNLIEQLFASQKKGK